MTYATQEKKGDELNRIYPEDLPVHQWYRFVLSYPPHVVREYVEKFDLTDGDHVLDPFCGTGTTVVECKKNGLSSTGLENNPVVQFAARTKATWDVDPDALEAHAEEVADATNEVLDREGVPDKPFFEPCSVDAVITSPPYPNEKDYSRTTRLESVLLGFMEDRKELRQHKKGFIRSNTRGVYVADEDDRFIEGIARVTELADRIEERRKELGKTSGFEKLYHRVVRLYFGGMAQHLKTLQPALKPGAQLAYVVGDQASYFRIPIRTGEILADLAERLGYQVTDLDLFRTRFSTATQDELHEEVLCLTWNS